MIPMILVKIINFQLLVLVINDPHHKILEPLIDYNSAAAWQYLRE